MKNHNKTNICQMVSKRSTCSNQTLDTPSKLMMMVHHSTSRQSMKNMTDDWKNTSSPSISRMETCVFLGVTLLYLKLSCYAFRPSYLEHRLSLYSLQRSCHCVFLRRSLWRIVYLPQVLYEDHHSQAVWFVN